MSNRDDNRRRQIDPRAGSRSAKTDNGHLTLVDSPALRDARVCDCEQIIAEDGGPDQFIAGLLHRSFVLVHSATSAIGATAQGFLSAILNTYTRLDEFSPQASEAQDDSQPDSD